MKKIILLAIFILGLAACVNPTDKYVESFKRLPEILKEKLTKAVALAEELGTKLENTKTLLEKNVTDLTVADVQQINDALERVEVILDSPDFKLALDQLKADPETKKIVVDTINEQTTKIQEAIDNPAVSADVKIQLQAALNNVESILVLIN